MKPIYIMLSFTASGMCFKEWLSHSLNLPPQLLVGAIVVCVGFGCFHLKPVKQRSAFPTGVVRQCFDELRRMRAFKTLKSNDVTLGLKNKMTENFINAQVVLTNQKGKAQPILLARYKYVLENIHAFDDAELVKLARFMTSSLKS